MRIRKAAVVGAGTMGGGIAYLFSSIGLPVLIKDIEQGQLDLARAHLAAIYKRRVDRGQLPERAMREGLALVEYTLRYDGFGNVDLVVEAVPEEMCVKQAVFAELNEVCRRETILASNTSALSIAEMGAASRRPGRVVGMHFFNPAHVMKLVEVIPSASGETAPEVVEAVVQLARDMGKIPIVVQECPGFVVNRVLFPYLNEAVLCLQAGAATAGEIDAAMGREGFGWPMGPFALMDMLGLDVCHHILAYLDAQFGERVKEAALLQALFRAGRLGAKVERGFYDYPGNQHAPEVDALIASLRGDGGVANAGSAFTPGRLMAALLNEAFLCIEEGIASVEDVDTACIAGLGMAVRMGDELAHMGPLAYADLVGLDKVLAQLQDLEASLGLRFRPAPVLEHKVQSGLLGRASGRGFKVYT